MVDRTRIRQLAQLVLLREAETLSAAEQARHSRDQHEQANAARELAAENRDAAQQLWARLLGEARPDPGLVRIGGNWLLEQERELENRDLDLAIAASRLDKARQDHAQALGREGAARKIGAKARKAMENLLEERQSVELADSLLWRWQR